MFLMSQYKTNKYKELHNKTYLSDSMRKSSFHVFFNVENDSFEIVNFLKEKNRVDRGRVIKEETMEDWVKSGKILNVEFFVSFLEVYNTLKNNKELDESIVNAKQNHKIKL